MPRRRQPDELLILAGDIVAGWIRNQAIPEERIAGVVHRLHVQLKRMDGGRYLAWEGEAPLGPDVLDAAEEERAARAAEPPVPAEPPEIKVYPPPRHPLAQPEVTYEEKKAGTVTDEKITCLECGRPVALMKTHLKAMHDGMTWAEYRDRHALRDDYPAASDKHREDQRAQMKEFRTTGKRIPEDQLKRKPKKKTDVTAKPGSRHPGIVDVDFSGNNPRNRPQPDDDGLGKTG